MNSLQRFRLSKNLSRSEIAKLLGISESYYTKIELGIRNPSYNFLKKFKSKFRCTLDEIFFAN
ncbi:DNA-binding protein [Clostridium perfringens ATCC 13124]|uniref:DNA-binding protein n=1 Tax=Clostridium perfringens (strain ATCC 13124 / DSM 756 / JCM 1290 / NCIMB 6125 / NCTC 8237 / Type A) TaxID=195103 RepID=A0A0H2YTT1_CLOP1|nr:helix-turn-helix domain-containing protein [Clostridium perfringens]ABG84175.1 DNA-binding protein [Clostridium perfringens ATCC 13124]MDM0932767.1 helix-turn-helix transcriptional regulator [Clostridium perfringens]